MKSALRPQAFSKRKSNPEFPKNLGFWQVVIPFWDSARRENGTFSVP
jgi:hypothetical protein